MQTTLRMCCAEGSIMRPFVAQFAFASPRASLLYDVPRLGAWMSAQGTKRPTEALIVGSALRAHSGNLSAEESGISCSLHAAAANGGPCGDTSDDAAMWAWVSHLVSSVRARALLQGGVAVALTLDKKAPVLCPSPLAGVLASAMGPSTPRLTDVIVVIGGPSGLARGWASRLDAAIGEPRLAVSLRGGLQHSYAALLDVLLMHERAELVPALQDRLAVPAALLKRARAAEHELRRTWLACIGLSSAPGQAVPTGQGSPARGSTVEALSHALDAGHRKCMAVLASELSKASGVLKAAAAQAGPAGASGSEATMRRVPPVEPAGSEPTASRRGAKRSKRPRPALDAGGRLEVAADSTAVHGAQDMAAESNGQARSSNGQILARARAPAAESRQHAKAARKKARRRQEQLAALS